MGIDRVCAAACETDGRGFAAGSSIIKRKISLPRHLLQQLGRRRDIIALRHNRLTAETRRHGCNGCHLYVHVCSDDATAYTERDSV